MPLHPLAGKLAPKSILTNIPRLISAYYTHSPDPSDATQLVSFGTSGHRGESLKGTFNEPHILAITQAICEYRSQNGITGPLFLGMDTHGLSEPAHTTALEVLAANKVQVRCHQDGDYTPTPVISHAILTYNRDHAPSLADGIVITPSHNPPDHGGIKYNPPSGGPASTTITQWIADRANDLLREGCAGVARLCGPAETVQEYDYITPYVQDLANVLDMQAISQAGLRIAADALGGAGLAFWRVIAQTYDLNIEVLNDHPDPTFSFMCVDKDGKIRMDCSSASAMAGLIELKDRFDIAYGNDPDFDRHGIVCPGTGLMDPNAYLAVAIDYLFRHRDWPTETAIGKTVVSSCMIDRVAAALGRTLFEVPVGFKWFVDGLLDGSLGFGGEESAGASFLRRDGRVWSTDKDGIILSLLAVEITAVTGKSPAQYYGELVARFGNPVYQRVDTPATAEQKRALNNLSPDDVKVDTLAGDPIQAILTKAPGNNASIGGLKLRTANGWFAARPSGTEEICKVYAESFLGEKHLEQLLREARTIIG